MTDLAAALATTPDAGLRRLLDLLPQERGKLDPELRETAMTCAEDRARLWSQPDGQRVTSMWDQRRAALTAYREQAHPDRDDIDGRLVLRTLLHEHHLRAVGVDPGVEKVTNRLARAIAQRRLALQRQGTP